ncbi:hypothetical protein ISO4_01439 [Alcanivorax venustensis ISO4]|uniref:Uncharacterized protein n=1 Tax=Alloalcanivorax venustensis ISO4 TaxID=1177184 RepID=A0ABS0AGS9_9GAMM|nr:hypothetical protein [Alloalcanivorax venustensis ISO4]
MTHAARGEVAGVGKRPFIGISALFIQLLEFMLSNTDLTPDFQGARPALSQKLQGYRADRHGVSGDILTDFAVSTGRCPYQLAIFVQKADRKTVEFEFTAVFNLDALAVEKAEVIRFPI